MTKNVTIRLNCHELLNCEENFSVSLWLDKDGLPGMQRLGEVRGMDRRDTMRKATIFALRWLMARKLKGRIVDSTPR